MQTVNCPLSANRHADYALDFEMLGVDYSAPTFEMQIRPTPGDTGTPLVSLTSALVGSDGLWRVYHADWVHPVSGAVVGGTELSVRISKGTLESLPFASDDPAAPLVLAYDIRMSPAGGGAAIVMTGTFTLLPGVTI